MDCRTEDWRSGGCPVIHMLESFPVIQKSKYTYREVTKSMVIPARDGINQTSGVKLTNSGSERLFGPWRAVAKLGPTLVVDNPCNNRRIVLVLIYHDLELTGEFLLLLGVGLSPICRHTRHVLDNGKAHLIAGSVEQIGLNFDLQVTRQ